jgi:hypothetical protein
MMIVIANLRLSGAFTLAARSGFDLLVLIVAGRGNPDTVSDIVFGCYPTDIN